MYVHHTFVFALHTNRSCYLSRLRLLFLFIAWLVLSVFMLTALPFFQVALSIFMSSASALRSLVHQLCLASELDRSSTNISAINQEARCRLRSNLLQDNVGQAVK